MILVLSGHTFKYETESLCKMFFSCQRFQIEYEAGDLSRNEMIFTRMKRGKTHTLFYAFVRGKGRTCSKSIQVENPAAQEKNECERLLGLCVHGALSQFVGCSTKWGILTGIRPVKRIHEYWEQGKSDEEIKTVLERDYLVSPQKAELCLQTARVQTPLLKCTQPKSFSLYISIPYCPSRCSYCSFVSHSITNRSALKLVPSYVEHLCREIAYTGKLAASLGLRLESVYWGGGTPTTLEPEQLAQILSAVEQNFDLSTLREYTVEAGRPDTITEEKLLVLKNAGVGRISINPQTFQDAVLEEIGRRHTAQMAVEKYELARRVGFDCINMDLIAGLPKDSLEGFCRTVDRAVSLGPENITVHTLSVKRSSSLFQSDGLPQNLKDNPAGEMVDYAQNTLMNAGYAPYYLYRQKNTLENLENVGYAKPGTEGLYNVYIMEEVHTILAVGASGVTKLVNPKNGLIDRVFNYKFPYEYIDHFDVMIDRKRKVAEFYEQQF